MVAKYSLAVPNYINTSKKFHYPLDKPPKIEYFDQLPIPQSEFVSHRDKLCDYCFFGGLIETQPLPLPPDI